MGNKSPITFEVDGGTVFFRDALGKQVCFMNSPQMKGKWDEDLLGEMAKAMTKRLEGFTRCRYATKGNGNTVRCMDGQIGTGLGSRTCPGCGGVGWFPVVPKEPVILGSNPVWQRLGKYVPPGQGDKQLMQSRMDTTKIDHLRGIE